MTIDHAKAKEMVVRLHELPGVGWHAIQKAVAQSLWTKAEGMTEADWLEAGFQRAQALSAAVRMQEPMLKEDSPAERAIRLGASVITPYDDLYPAAMRQMPQPPWVLYAWGRLELLERPSIAVVGTRNPTAYGRHTAAQLAEQLSASGLTVISGLARGIDAVAHQAALQKAGGTIAVLASAVNSCYPSENRELYRQISEQGLLLSETPIGAKLHPGMFPLRNRIIAGLSLGTLVVEAAKGSGSLITADQAVEMSRDVFAVPGPISSPKSEGANELIGKGAKLVSRVEHIIEEFPWLTEQLNRISGVNRLKKGHSAEAEQSSLSAEERKLIEILRDQPLSMNDLHQITAIPFGHLSALLINLCIKRKIEQQPGSLYIVL
ncbi:DNA-processing protein DprA [Paenibacillus gorillae]|uniref:DNA-processing protein DprA n=1 Tax=Paenibacillus gorillae TaxID=1243662 RepID=UPI0004BB8004|nr:DNA-processing protein DprA [Paenibacillus gorillae]